MKTIKLGEGIEDIQFGILPSDLEKRLGKASIVDLAEEDGMEVWHYDELSLSFGFSHDFDKRLLSITSSDSEAHIEEVTLIGDPLQEVMDKLEVFNFGNLDIEDISSPEFPNQQLLTIFDFSLNLWFEEDELCEIQWGPFWDEDTDTPIWPE